MISRRQFLRGRFATANTPKPPNNPDAPKMAVIGVDCIAFAQNVVCRSCGDVCEAAAIRFSPRLNAAACPAVLAERCTGCSECVSACPASAITLTALAVQSK
jgi:ferredoxin-type protein NapF